MTKNAMITTTLCPRSDCHMDPEEARARAASRKASRMASRDRGEEEAGVVSVEELSEGLL